MLDKTLPHRQIEAMHKVRQGDAELVEIRTRCGCSKKLAIPFNQSYIQVAYIKSNEALLDFALFDENSIVGSSSSMMTTTRTFEYVKYYDPKSGYGRIFMETDTVSPEIDRLKAELVTQAALHKKDMQEQDNYIASLYIKIDRGFARYIKRIEYWRTLYRHSFWHRVFLYFKRMRTSKWY